MSKSPSRNKAIKTLRFKVKPESVAWLDQAAREVNAVWNWANATSEKAVKRFAGKPIWLTGFDLCKLSAGATESFERIGADTIQRINVEYATKRKAAKRVKLRFRASGGRKRALGWIPFKAASLKRKGRAVRFCGKTIRVFEADRLAELTGWKEGSFSQNALGDWYLNLPVQFETGNEPAPLDAVGIDLGLKATATTSDGDVLEPTNAYRDLESKIAQAQRRGHKRQAKRLHAKAANRRKDALHKFTTNLVKKYQHIVIGDVSSTKLAKTRMSKSVLDAGWGLLKAQVECKGQWAGRSVEIRCERNSTRRCSKCGQLTGPTGLRQLVVRHWSCSACCAEHDRDINAAINIRDQRPAQERAAVCGNERSRHAPTSPAMPITGVGEAGIRA